MDSDSKLETAPSSEGRYHVNLKLRFYNPNLRLNLRLVQLFAYRFKLRLCFIMKKIAFELRLNSIQAIKLCELLEVIEKKLQGLLILMFFQLSEHMAILFLKITSLR